MEERVRHTTLNVPKSNYYELIQFL